MRSSLSSRERNLLEAMVSRTTVKEAAISVGIDPSYVNQVSLRVRKKRSAALELLRDLARYEKRSPLISKILAERR